MLSATYQLLWFINTYSFQMRLSSVFSKQNIGFFCILLFMILNKYLPPWKFCIFLLSADLLQVQHF